MVKIERLTERQIYGMFGDPIKEPERIKKHLVSITPPMPLVGTNGLPIKKVTMNKYIADSWVDALNEIRDKYTVDGIIDNKLNIFGGCFNIRNAKGDGTFLSKHSWGLAVDHLMQLGPYGSRDIMPYHFVHAFIKRGWDWGGHWPEMYPGCTVLDGMHFSTGG